jgi:hypothetical protein
MKVLQSILLSAFCLVSASAHSAPTASEQARQRLTNALRGQIKQFLTASLSKNPPATGAPTEEQLNQQADSLLQQALVRYGPVFTLPETTAESLVTKGPNDADNAAAMKRNWETYKKIRGKLPALLKHLHEQFDAGAIKGGWDVEVARRVSDAHITEATDAQRRSEESKKKP